MAAPMERVLYEVKRVIVGQDHLLERLLVALLARGHILVEGVPGPGQDDGHQDARRDHRRRLQAHPVHARPGARRPHRHPHLRPEAGEFHTSLGPVFTNLLLADEINRAPAKVQSALLEVMQERQVTIGRETHRVPEPVPGAGHPEPHRDRRHLRAAGGPGRPIHAQGPRGLPDADRGVRHRRAPDRRRRRRPSRCSPRSGCSSLQRQVDGVFVDPALIEYAVRMVSATREPEAHGIRDLGRYITFGGSPRASINLILTAKALAFVRGRDYALPQDVLDMALDVLRHRLVLSYEALTDDVTSDDLLRTIIGRIPVPVVPLRGHSDIRVSA